MLKRIKQFIGDNPARLTAQLSELETNVADEFVAIRASTAPEMIPLSFLTSPGSTRSFTAGNAAECDTTIGNVTLTLTRPVSRGFAWVIKKTSANNVIVVPAGVSAPGVPTQINGSSTKTYPSVGAYPLYFDGSNWYG